MACRPLGAPPWERYNNCGGVPTFTPDWSCLFHASNHCPSMPPNQGQVHVVFCGQNERIWMGCLRQTSLSIECNLLPLLYIP